MDDYASSAIDVDGSRLQLPSAVAPLAKPARYKILHGGRGSGKSWSIARHCLLDGLNAPLRVLCTRETQKSIAESVHHLLATQIQEMGLNHLYKVQESVIYGPNGTEFAFCGLRQQGIVNIKSYEGFERVWVEEAQVVTKKSWDILIPTIRKPGSEIWISFNPELDTDETYRRFVVDPPQDSVVIAMTYRDNPWFPDVLDLERRDMLKRDPEGYQNVWEGKPHAVVAGAIYKREIIALLESQRLRQVPYDPMLKVHCIWDLGFVRMPVTLVQRQGSELRIIEYLENEGADYAGVVIELEKRRYNWGYDWLPHDAESHSPHTGKTPKQIVQALGRKVRIVERLDIEQGIAAARMIFPRVYVDKDKAGLLVERLKRYRRTVPVATGEPAGPLHDENSDGADTFRYLATVADRLDNEQEFKPFVKPFRAHDSGVGY